MSVRRLLNPCKTVAYSHQISVISSTPTVIRAPYSRFMEFLLLWWDNLDDLTHACRHLATTAITEIAEAATAPFAAGLSAMSAWILLRLQG